MNGEYRPQRLFFFAAHDHSTSQIRLRRAFGLIMLFRLFSLSAIFCGQTIAAPPPTALPGKVSECAARLTPANPPNEGILLVDHSAKRRSGRLGHALVHYEPGKLLAFYPNCSGDNGGHSGIP